MRIIKNPGEVIAGLQNTGLQNIRPGVTNANLAAQMASGGATQRRASGVAGVDTLDFSMTTDTAAATVFAIPASPTVLLEQGLTLDDFSGGTYGPETSGDVSNAVMEQINQVGRVVVNEMQLILASGTSLNGTLEYFTGGIFQKTQPEYVSANDSASRFQEQGTYLVFRFPNGKILDTNSCFVFTFNATPGGAETHRLTVSFGAVGTLNPIVPNAGMRTF